MSSRLLVFTTTIQAASKLATTDQQLAPLLSPLLNSLPDPCLKRQSYQDLRVPINNLIASHGLNLIILETTPIPGLNTKYLTKVLT
jgi:hypothetical protein